MYAIIEIDGTQHKVEKNRKIYVNRMKDAKGAIVEFNRVLLVDKEGEISVGAPFVSGIRVAAKVLGHTKDDKVLVFKHKRRKGYRKFNGHRQYLTQLLIKGILSEGEVLEIEEEVIEEQPQEVVENAVNDEAVIENQEEVETEESESEEVETSEGEPAEIEIEAEGEEQDEGTTPKKKWKLFSKKKKEKGKQELVEEITDENTSSPEMETGIMEDKEAGSAEETEEDAIEDVENKTDEESEETAEEK